MIAKRTGGVVVELTQEEAEALKRALLVAYQVIERGALGPIGALLRALQQA